MPPSRVRILALFFTACLASLLQPGRLPAFDPPQESGDEKILAMFEQDVKELSAAIEQDPDAVDLYSQRGDAHFFLARFEDAVADYDRTVELQPNLDSSHWRRGIAYFYAGRYEDAAGQFERYHSFDNVDRENGIWRYLSQVKAYGQEKAREGLLKYEKDDREPFPDVYRLFAGAISADDILQHISDAEIDDRNREKRLFYAELYIGLELAVSDKTAAAREHLAIVADNTWPEPAGYGPRYMWHVARLHRDLIDNDDGDETDDTQ